MPLASRGGCRRRYSRHSPEIKGKKEFVKLDKFAVKEVYFAVKKVYFAVKKVHYII